MEQFSQIMTWLDDFVWGIPMIVLLLGTHLFMTLRTGFIQRKTLTGIKLSVTKDPDSPGDVSQFQALTTALASTIGTGNIIGVGTAIFLGGPGAVFWCWIAGVFGIATKYAESFIAVKYRVRTPDGKMQGGAMYARVCEKLVPLMAVFYVLGCVIILGINYDFILPAVGAILRLAFTPGAVAGGLVGQGVMIALRFGVARGLFSNESGMGSAPLVASAAQTRNPVRQALVSATGTFWDTVVVCLMTGLVLVSTIMKNPEINMDTIADGGQLTTAAFSQIPVLGPIILVVGIITFAWSTILGWSYYGERCAQYLWGKKALLPYKLLFVAVVVVGPVLALDLVWTIADILNALMAIPNLIAVLLLSGVTARETNYYLNHLEETDRTEIPLVDR